MRRTALALIAALAVAGNLVAQERQGAQKPQEPTRQTQQGAKTPPMTQRQMQLQHMAQHTDGLALQIRETNRWMEQKQVRAEYRQLGASLAQSCDQLREMVRQTQQLRDQIRDTKQDRDRLQQLDRLQDRLRDMDRNMTQAHDALQKMVGKS
jgi:methyl-accepting chemotaxis protein